MVCLAYNLKRLHALLGGVLPSVALARAVQRATPPSGGLLGTAYRQLGRARRLLVGRLFHHGPHLAAPRWAPRRAAPMIISCYPFSPTGC
jgi:hypothetical protein